MTLEGGVLLPHLAGTAALPRIERIAILNPVSRAVHPYHPGSTFGPREGSPTTAVVSKRDKSSVAVKQHFFTSHRSGHQYTVPLTCVGTSKRKQE